MEQLEKIAVKIGQGDDLNDLRVEPKVMEPYDPIPGRVPRKVAIDRRKKEYASFSIEQLLV
jgi:dynein heavy chain